MESVGYREVRTSQYVLVKQLIPQNPGTTRLGAIHWYAGKVVEVSNKWMRLRLNGKDFVMPQEGDEHFYIFENKKAYQKFIDAFKVEDYDGDI